MKPAKLPTGEHVPALGMGTWSMGDRASRRAEEIKCLQRGIDLGMNLIDTAEMYGDGAAETLVGEAIVGRRENVFLVSEVIGPRPQIAPKKQHFPMCFARHGENIHIYKSIT